MQRIFASSIQLEQITIDLTDDIKKCKEDEEATKVPKTKKLLQGQEESTCSLQETPTHSDQEMSTDTHRGKQLRIGSQGKNLMYGKKFATTNSSTHSDQDELMRSNQDERTHSEQDTGTDTDQVKQQHFGKGKKLMSGRNHLVEDSEESASEDSDKEPVYFSSVSMIKSVRNSSSRNSISNASEASEAPVRAAPGILAASKAKSAKKGGLKADSLTYPPSPCTRILSVDTLPKAPVLAAAPAQPAKADRVAPDPAPPPKKKLRPTRSCKQTNVCEYPGCKYANKKPVLCNICDINKLHHVCQNEYDHEHWNNAVEDKYAPQKVCFTCAMAMLEEN